MLGSQAQQIRSLLYKVCGCCLTKFHYHKVEAHGLPYTTGTKGIYGNAYSSIPYRRKLYAHQSVTRKFLHSHKGNAKYNRPRSHVLLEPLPLLAGREEEALHSHYGCNFSKDTKWPAVWRIKIKEHCWNDTRDTYWIFHSDCTGLSRDNDTHCIIIWWNKNILYNLNSRIL